MTTLDKCHVTGFVTLPDGSHSAGNLRITLTKFDRENDNTIAPAAILAPIATDGSLAIDLWPNAEGDGGSYYVCSLLIGSTEYPPFTIVVPDNDNATLATIMLVTPPVAIDDAEAAALASQASAVVSGNNATDAAASAAAAATSASAASGSATNATTSETNAAASAAAAATSASAASGSATTSGNNATAAAASAAAAATSASAASGSAAATAADRVQTDADAIATSADRAQTDAAVISTSASAAAAATSATNAATSETNAAASAAGASTTKSAMDVALANVSGLAALSNLPFAAYQIASATDVVDVCVYDTTRDSDGGAWRRRVNWTSWFKETLTTGPWLGVAANETAARLLTGAGTGAYYQNTTDKNFYSLNAGSGQTQVYRGMRNQFPSKALIVARAGSVTLYDLDSPSCPMWMMFVVGGTAPLTVNMLGATGYTANSLAALNGLIYTGFAANGIAIIDFVIDRRDRIILDVQRYNGGIASRNAGLGHSGIAGSGLVNQSANDVAATVLPGTPVDRVRKLPTSTVAVATAGGVSVIHWDGRAANSGNTSAVVNVAFSADYTLWYAFSANPVLAFSPLFEYAAASWARHYYSSSSTPPVMTPNIAALATTLDKTAKGSIAGLELLKHQPASGFLVDSQANSSMIAYLSSKYNSGWQIGASLQALSESTADLGTLTNSSVIGTGTNLVTNGDFATDISGWTQGTQAVEASWVNGAMKIDNSAGGASNQSCGSQILNVPVGWYIAEADVTVAIGSAQLIMIKPGGTSIGKTNSGGSGHMQCVFYNDTLRTVTFGCGANVTSIATFDNCTLKSLAATSDFLNNTELQTNGTFASGNLTTGWGAQSAWSYDAGTGSAHLQYAGSGSFMTSTVRIDPNTKYLVSFDYTWVSGNNIMGLGGVSTSLPNATGHQSFTINSGPSVSSLSFSTNSGTAEYYIDNVSVKAYVTTVLFDDFGGYADTAAMLAAGWSESNAGTSLALSGGAMAVGGASAARYGYRQITGLTVGARYTIKTDVSMSVAAQSLIQADASSPSGAGLGQTIVNATTAGATLTFIATSTSAYVIFWRNVADANTTVFDNIRVDLVNVDRSIAANTPLVYGQVTKIAVASGAEMAAFSNFAPTVSNYLEQLPKAAFDFGTGDFTLSAWVKWDGINSTCVMCYGTGAINAATGWRLIISSGGIAQLYMAGVTRQNGSNLAVAGWNYVIVSRISGTVYVMMNGLVTTTTSATDNLTCTGATLRVGHGGNWNGNAPTTTLNAAQAIALPRVSATGMMPSQMKDTYNSEFPLFQPNAKSLLPADSVSALAYDDTTDTMHVATTSGMARLKDLLVQDKDAIVVTGIDARGGNVVFRDGAQVKLNDMPNITLRGELLTPEPGGSYDRDLVKGGGVTTSATQTTIGKIPMDNGERGFWHVKAKATQYADGAAYLAYQRAIDIYRPEVGNIAIRGSVQTIGTDIESTSTADITLTVDTTAQTLDIKATGLAATNFEWNWEARRV